MGVTVKINFYFNSYFIICQLIAFILEKKYVQFYIDYVQCFDFAIIAIMVL